MHKFNFVVEVHQKLSENADLDVHDKKELCSSVEFANSLLLWYLQHAPQTKDKDDSREYELGNEHQSSLDLRHVFVLSVCISNSCAYEEANQEKETLSAAQRKDQLLQWI